MNTLNNCITKQHSNSKITVRCDMWSFIDEQKCMDVCISGVSCAIVDKPGSPQGPLEAVETTPSAIKLQWKPPKDDGGSRIERYVLEKKPKGSNKWTKCPGHIGPDETEATAKNLEEGQEYDFRVVAVNQEGESEPLVTTEPIKAKYPFGTYTDCSNIVWLGIIR